MADTDKKPTEPPEPAESSNPFAANCLWGGVYAFAAFFLGQPQYPGGYIGVAAFFVIGFLWNPARMKKGQKTKIEKEWESAKEALLEDSKEKTSDTAEKEKASTTDKP